MEELLKKLTSLKGILLLTTHGTLYVLANFKVFETTIVRRRLLFTKQSEQVRYISEIELDKVGKMTFTHEDSTKVNAVIGDLVNDRTRYLRMLRDLNDHNYTIRRKA